MSCNNVGFQGLFRAWRWKRCPMQKLFIYALAACTILMAAPAVAYEGPWCLRASIGRGVVSEICHFRTFEACAQ